MSAADCFSALPFAFGVGLVRKRCISCRKAIASGDVCSITCYQSLAPFLKSMINWPVDSKKLPWYIRLMQWIKSKKQVQSISNSVQQLKDAREIEIKRLPIVEQFNKLFPVMKFEMDGHALYFQTKAQADEYARLHNFLLRSDPQVEDELQSMKKMILQ